MARLRRGSLSKDGERRCRDFPRLDALLRTKPGSLLSHPRVGASAADGMVNVEFPHGSVLMRRDQAVAVHAAMDQCAGIRLRDRTARLNEADAVGEKNQECTILPRRHELTIQHDTERGEWILKQRNWPDEDSLIILSDEDIHEFADVLTDHLGYGRAP
jgi:hypothetical protein